MARKKHPKESDPVARRRPTRSRGLVFEELEPRLLLSTLTPVDAEAAAALDHLAPAADALQQLASEPEVPGIPDAPIAAAVQPRAEIVFIDTSVYDYETLRAGISANAEVVQLDPTRDGIAQITETLANRSGLDAIHIVSHGARGALQLGDAWLQLGDLDQHKSQLESWSEALTDDADILLYACDLAGTESGRSMLSAIADLTGADVAASTNQTGSAALGGDWQLEYRSGTVSAATAIGDETQQEWSGLLAPFIVTNTNDSGGGSLRQAILNANALAGLDTISFNIGTSDPGYRDPTPGSPNSGDEYWRIRPTSFLGWITDPVVLDATTQPGYNAASGRPVIEIDGSLASGATGIIVLRTNDSTVRGFAVHSSADDGIEIDGIDGFGDNNLIQGNWSGLDGAGNVRGNTDHGIIVAANTDGNVIEGNVTVGNSSSGIHLRDNSTNNIIRGNWIGVLPNGTAAGNAQNGIDISTTTSGSMIGGTGVDDGNWIAHNGWDGIAASNDSGTGNTILGNSIYSNGGLGIDLNNDGVTANDAGDADTGPNALQNYPVLTAATTSGTSITITGTLNSTLPPDRYFRVEFFASSSQDASGHGEGRRYLGFANVQTNGIGNATINATLTTPVLAGEFISATATRSVLGYTSYTDTSEFSQSLAATTQSPVATADSATVAEGGVQTIDVGANDSDPEGALDLASTQIVSGPARGSVVVNANGTVTYTHNGSETTFDSFTYRIRDLAGAWSNVATVSLTVTPVNDTPIAVNDSATVAEGAAATINLAANDIDAEGSLNLASIQIVTGPARGAAVVNANGTVSYTHDGSETTSDSFTYTIRDAAGAVSNVATVSLTIAPVNDAPVAVGDAATVAEGGATTINLAANDSDADNALNLASIQIVSAPARGSVVVNANGSVTYTHDGSETTSDSFTYTIRDAAGAVSNAATVSLTVTPVNDPPVAVANAATVAEGGATTIDLAANDSDVDNALDLASIQIVTGPANGSVVVNANGTVTYTHDGSETVSDSFTYTIRDAAGAVSNAATVSLTVTPVNDPPVAAGDAATLPEGAAATIDLAANDSGADDALDLGSVQIVAGPANGSVVVNGDGTVTYTHDGSETATDSFTYTIRDASGAVSNVATVTLTITPVNDAPVAAADAAIVAEGGVATIDLAANDTDADDALDLGSVQIVSGAANGSIVVNGDGTITYTHDGSETTSDSFTYTIRDASGAVSNVATVGLTVTPVNDAPVAVADAAILAEAASTPIDLAANDTDADSALDLASIQIVAGPANGSVVVNGDGTITYTHDGSETTSDSFTYTVRDTSGAVSNIAAVAITVTPVNDAPVASDDAATLAEGGATTIDLAASDSDADDALDLTSIQIVTGPANGSIVVNGDGTVTYTHDGSETTSDSFTYTIRDASGAVSNVATVSLTVTPVNDAPIAAADAAILAEGGATTVDLAANDTDADNALDLASIQIVSGPANGSVIVNGDGTITYTHDGGETTSDSFTYTIRDAAGASSNLGVVSLAITPVEETPIAAADSAALAEGSAITIDLAANDLDPEGLLDLTSIQIVAGPAHGLVLVNGDGTVQYVHDGGETTADSFTYVIRDVANGISNAAAVTLAVTPVSDAPTFINNQLMIASGGTAVLSPAELSAIDVDDPAPGLLFTVSGLTGGRFEMVSNPGVPVTSFSQAQIAAGQVRFVHDGTAVAPAYDVTVSDGVASAGPMAAQTQLVTSSVLVVGEEDDGGTAPPVEPVPGAGPDSGGGTATRDVPGAGASSAGDPSAAIRGNSRADWQRHFMTERSLLETTDAGALGWTGASRNDDRDVSIELQTEALALGKNLLASLDDLRRDLSRHQLETGAWRRASIEGVAIAFSAGFIAAALRSSSLWAAMLSLMPAWQRLDPLVVLAVSREERRRRLEEIRRADARRQKLGGVLDERS